MADSRAESGKVQDEPGTLHSAKKKSAQKITGIQQKNLEANLKGLTMAKSGIITAKKKKSNYHTKDKKTPRVHTGVTF